MLRQIGRRLLSIVPTMFIVTLIVFLGVNLLPGDPVSSALGAGATQTDIDAARAALGLDLPLWQRYIDWLLAFLRGDMGTSFVSGAPVLPTLAARLPATLILMVAAMLIATAIGIPSGAIAAARRNSAFDSVTRIVALFGMTMPSFWLALMLILIFAYYIPIFPTTGSGSLRHLVLPAVTLGITLTGVIMRLTRSSMLESLGAEYVRTARAKGVPERTVITRHALGNALLPVITIVGLQIGTLMGGAIVVEAVFSWPGLGFFTYQAMLKRDYPVIMGSIVLFALMFLLINLLTDIAYSIVDPRIRQGART